MVPFGNVGSQAIGLQWPSFHTAHVFLELMYLSFSLAKHFSCSDILDCKSTSPLSASLACSWYTSPRGATPSCTHILSKSPRHPWRAFSSETALTNTVSSRFLVANFLISSLAPSSFGQCHVGTFRWKSAEIGQHPSAGSTSAPCLDICCLISESNSTSYKHSRRILDLAT